MANTWKECRYCDKMTNDVFTVPVWTLLGPRVRTLYACRGCFNGGDV